MTTLPDTPAVALALRQGRVREALCHASAALDAAELHGRPHEMVAALAGVARCYRDLDAVHAARGALQHALAWAQAALGADTEVDLLCELAELGCLTAERADDATGSAPPGAGHAALEQARDHAFDATRQLHRVSDPAWEARVLLRLADVLARCGDHDDAARLQGLALERLGRWASGFGELDVAQALGA